MFSENQIHPYRIPLEVNSNGELSAAWKGKWIFEGSGLFFKAKSFRKNRKRCRRLLPHSQ